MPRGTKTQTETAYPEGTRTSDVENAQTGENAEGAGGQGKRTLGAAEAELEHPLGIVFLDPYIRGFRSLLPTGRPPSLPFSRDDFALRLDFVEPTHAGQISLIP